jgi:DNA-binding XRE family transcriptional regulator
MSAFSWEIETSDEFVDWYRSLDEDEVESVNFSVDLLGRTGPVLRRPHVDTIKGSTIPNLKELRVQHEGKPLRILFAFDPRRVGYLILGGDKTGNDDWYAIVRSARREDFPEASDRDREVIMVNKWKDVRRAQTPERETRVKARVEREIGRLPLTELRKARLMTQARLAELLQVNQGAISKMEKRSDMYLSTLRSYVEAMGGNLDIRAVFPDGEIVLDHLSDVREEPRQAVSA